MDIKTYNPEKRKSRIRKGGAFSVLVYIGEKFVNLGNVLSFFISSFFMSIRTFFMTKRRFREFQAKHQKIYDLR